MILMKIKVIKIKHLITMNPKEHKKNIQKINYILIKQKNKTMN